jgi:hypothetical protein
MPKLYKKINNTTTKKLVAKAPSREMTYSYESDHDEYLNKQILDADRELQITDELL